jgi:hypothetical protein
VKKFNWPWALFCLIMVLIAWYFSLGCAHNAYYEQHQKYQADHEWCMNYNTSSNTRLTYHPQTYKECMYMLGH